MQNKIKIRTWYSDDFNDYSSCGGNGFSVPQFELDTKLNVLVPKLDKDGKRVYHNLYEDIQKFKDTNSLERIISLGQDVDNLSILCNSSDEALKKSIDYTQYANIEQLKDANMNLNKMGLTPDSALKVANEFVKNKIKESQKQGVENEKSQETGQDKK